MHAAHTVFSQKLLQVHILELKEPPIRRQGAIPEERSEELIEACSAISSTSTAITAVIADWSIAIPHGAPSQRVLIKIQPVFVYKRSRKCFNCREAGGNVLFSKSHTIKKHKLPDGPDGR